MRRVLDVGGLFFERAPEERIAARVRLTVVRRRIAALPEVPGAEAVDQRRIAAGGRLEIVARNLAANAAARFRKAGEPRAGTRQTSSGTAGRQQETEHQSARRVTHVVRIY